MKRYAAVLRDRGVIRLLAGTAISRLAASSMSVALLVALVQEGSVVEAGGVLAAFGAGAALGAPLSARRADRHGTRLVVGLLIGVQAAALVGLIAIVGSGASMPALSLSALVLGAVAPPTAPIVRGSWPALVPSERLPAMYALDSTSNSAMFVAGPALVGLLSTAVAPLWLIGVAGGLRVAGDLLIVTSPHLGRGAQSASPRSDASVLRQPFVAVLLIAIALDTFSFGVVQVGASVVVPVALIGLMIALFAAGEVAGGLVVGAVARPTSHVRVLVLLNAAAIPLIAALAVPGPAVVIAILYLVAGLSSGGRDALNQVVLSSASSVSPSATFAVLGTFMWGGYSLGSWTAGRLSPLGPSAMFVTAAVALVVAAVLIGLFAFRSPAGRTT